jgi:hypothetical protein
MNEMDGLNEVGGDHKFGDPQATLECGASGFVLRLDVVMSSLAVSEFSESSCTSAIRMKDLARCRKFCTPILAASTWHEEEPPMNLDEHRLPMQYAGVEQVDCGSERGKSGGRS